MGWAPTFDTLIGGLGLVASCVGVWMSWLSLKEAALAKDQAKLAKEAAISAEKAANDARDSVRREDRKAKLITKLTQLLTQTNIMRATEGDLLELNCEPKLIELRRELVSCANAANASYNAIANRLMLAATSVDDFEGVRTGDDQEIIVSRRRLLVELGNTISETHSELELGIYDHGK
jgi:uncharacterized protein YicC (UPF0701 family)